MSIGASLFLIAIGAILKYAVTVSVQGVDLQVVGVIGLLASLAYAAATGRDPGR